MFRVYPEPRRANPTRSLYPVYAEPRSDPRRARGILSAKPVPVPSSSDLCELCASVFSSPDLCPFNSRLLALSVVEGSTFNYLPNSHRITSFAYPHPLTPIESHSCKKQGGGGYYVGSRPYFIASLRLCFRLLFHSNKSGCSRVIRSHIGWNWNHPASGLPTCECVSLAVS